VTEIYTIGEGFDKWALKAIDTAMKNSRLPDGFTIVPERYPKNVKHPFIVVGVFSSLKTVRDAFHDGASDCISISYDVETLTREFDKCADDTNSPK